MIDEKRAPSIADLCRDCGVSQSTARRRLKAWRAGELDRAALFAPPRRYSGDLNALAREVALKTGLYFEGARQRVKKWSAGKLSDSELYAPTRRILYDSPQDLPPAEVLAQTLGISLEAAYSRIRRYRSGEMTLEQALAAPVVKNPPAVIARIVETAGIGWGAARARYLKFRRGEIDEEALYRTRSESAVGRKRQVGAWDGLSNRSRDARLRDIPGPTPLERRVLGW